VVVSDIESKELTKVLEESLQVAVEATSPFDITRRNNASVESSKAFGAAVADQYPAAFRPRFQKTKDSQELEVAEVVTEIPPLRLGVMSLILGAGLAIALFIAVIMGNEVSLKEVELRKKRDAVFVPQGLESLPWSQHKKAVDDLESELNKLKSALDSFNNLSGVFTSLSSRRTLPDGLWLENFQLNRQDKGYQAKISGYVFRDDDYKERLTLDDFVTKLKNDSSLQALFSTVEIESSRRQPQKEFLVTYFSINLK
ncbi:MAG: hypothetical protein KJ977_03250, partial [Candidatus Omnitrophica bacterium]|nr:hypothetical protein [Candidatus Omnitrophota bacterium]